MAAPIVNQNVLIDSLFRSNLNNIGFLNGNNNWTGQNTFYNYTWIHYQQFNVTGTIYANDFCYMNGTCIGGGGSTDLSAYIKNNTKANYVIYADKINATMGYFTELNVSKSSIYVGDIKMSSNDGYLNVTGNLTATYYYGSGKFLTDINLSNINGSATFGGDVIINGNLTVVQNLSANKICLNTNGCITSWPTAGDNTSWNQSLADTLYLGINNNGSFWLAINNSYINDSHLDNKIDGVNTTQNIMNLGFYNSTYLDPYLVSGGFRIYWFTNQTNNGGTRNMTTSLPTGAPTTLNIPIATNTVSLGMYITQKQNSTIIYAPGIRNIYLNMRIIDANRIIGVNTQVYRCVNYNEISDSCGQLVFFANSSQTVLTSTIFAEYKTSYFVNSTYSLNSTDRFLLNVTATKTSGLATTIQLQIDDMSYTRIEVPSPVGVTDITAKTEGSGTIGTIPIWTAQKTLSDSPIKREITDEDFMTIYDGDLYIDDTNGVVAINIIPGEESHAQALQVNSETKYSIVNLTTDGYNSSLGITLVHASSTLPESLTDASDVSVNGNSYYVFQSINSTAFYINGNHSFSTTNWSFFQAPYVDVNGPATSERGYSISTNNQWQWSMNVVDTSNNTKLCWQNSQNFYKGTSNMMCIDSISNQITTVGGMQLGDSVYVGYGASANNTLDTTVQPSGMFLPKKFIAIDSLDADDSGFVFGHEGKPVWDLSTFVNENAKYLHVGINYRTGDTSMLLSQTGRIGINKPDNILKYHVGFNGSGINDMESNGTYTGMFNDLFEVIMVNSSHYKWRLNINNAGWGAYSSNISLTTTPNVLYKGVTIYFKGIVNHTQNDTWYFTAFAQNPSGVFTIDPSAYIEVLVFNGSNYNDITFEAGTSAGIPFGGFNKTGQYLYVARNVPVSTTNFVLSTVASGLTLKAEYYNGSIWKTLNTSNMFNDKTYNLTISGPVSWDLSTMNDWSSNINVDDYTAANDYYWLRYSTTTNATISPKFNAITPNGIDRFQVYQSRFDTTPVFSVAPNGDTVITGTLQANGFYGEMYNTNTTTQTMTTQNTWYNITTFLGGEMSGWSLSNNQTLTCAQSGLYSVDFIVNAAVNNNDNVQYRALINGIIEPKSELLIRYSTNLANIANMKFLRRFNAGDSIYFQINDNQRNGAVITYDSRTVIVTRIGN